jgi:MoxR-like ATPase
MEGKERQEVRYEAAEDWAKGTPQYQPSIDGSERDNDGRVYYPYIPTKELQEAVNLAIALKRPLLIEGEPGCGKTRLAESIAYEFTQKYLKGQGWWYFQEWNVQSVSRARDGLYTFDAVGRLRDAQLKGSGATLPQDQLSELENRFKDKETYVEYGPLGKALTQNQCERPIVLIDEIDKADSDFPNDLLRELDRLEFTVTETAKTYPQKENKIKPIVIITSNRERSLPEAFLRRCLYFKLEFPEEEQLKKIISKHFKKINADLVQETVQHFLSIRETFQDYPGTKPPSTSEILDFLTVLQGQPLDEAIAIIKNLARSNYAHWLGTVLKTEKDQEIYRQNFGIEE